jgi:putative transcriptional regulator
MASTLRNGPIAALAAMLVPAWWLAAPPAAAQAPAPASLAGQLLVAAPSMGDPRFRETVIFMVHHNKDGAFGIVLNRPIGERPLAGLLEMIGEKEATVTGTVRIHVGVLHSTDYREPATLEVTAGVAMTSSRDILRGIGHGQGPKQSLIAFGYAGWAPGQLEGELARRDWAIAAGEPKLIFDEDRDKVWNTAFARRIQDL